MRFAWSFFLRVCLASNKRFLKSKHIDLHDGKFDAREGGGNYKYSSRQFCMRDELKDKIGSCEGEGM